MAEGGQVQFMAMTEQEISQISNQIGSEYKRLHTMLFLTNTQQYDIEQLYSNSTRDKIFNMLQKWHDVVHSEGENPRQLLAAALIAVDNRALAEHVYRGLIDEKWLPKSSTKNKLEQIMFERKAVKQNFKIIVKNNTITTTDDAQVVVDGKVTANENDMSQNEVIKIMNAVPPGHNLDLQYFTGGVDAHKNSRVNLNSGAEIVSGVVKQLENLTLGNQQPVDGDSVDGGNPTLNEEKINQIRKDRATKVPKEPASGFELKQKDKPLLKRKFNKTDEIKVLIDWVGSQDGSTTRFTITFPGSKIKINSWDCQGSLEDNEIITSYAFEVKWDLSIPETQYEYQYVTSQTSLPAQR